MDYIEKLKNNLESYNSIIWGEQGRLEDTRSELIASKSLIELDIKKLFSKLAYIESKLDYVDRELDELGFLYSVIASIFDPNSKNESIFYYYDIPDEYIPIFEENGLKVNEKMTIEKPDEFKLRKVKKDI